MKNRVRVSIVLISFWSGFAEVFAGIPLNQRHLSRSYYLQVCSWIHLGPTCGCTSKWTLWPTLRCPCFQCSVPYFHHRLRRPIIGGIIVQNASWRWIFWFIAIITGILMLLSALLLRETYAPVLLAWKQARAKIIINQSNNQTSSSTQSAWQQRLSNTSIYHRRGYHSTNNESFWWS